ncbi:uncharacterized protein LOC119323727 [Triticum dicoccoides]|uniref:uncharacterized protein LOC119323727 n=1 Tax=Triticum dicoccoides TaxID=85692 RepID=UPI0008427FE7|nr:uncharacterized protein LOC119323727 [Triticum dicoccoides]XP_044408868.1 uncharacterized protein LOC123133445 [Triticum aestivum]XP_044445606.1 uncharacterized protein LOC123172743 [Triticum aestivum]
MEVKKRAAAIAALCVLLVMSVPPQQRAAAETFCECYQPCHDGCSRSGWICKVDCIQKCKEEGYPEESRAACLWVCSTDSVCGPSAAPTDAEGAAACKHECHRRWGLV